MNQGVELDHSCRGRYQIQGGLVDKVSNPRNIVDDPILGGVIGGFHLEGDSPNIDVVAVASTEGTHAGAILVLIEIDVIRAHDARRDTRAGSRPCCDCDERLHEQHTPNNEVRRHHLFP